jgi:hypothetical protein
MKFRVLLCLATLALPMGLLAAEEKPVPTPKPSLWHRLTHPFGSKKKEAQGKGPVFKQLEMGLVVDPNPVKLADNRQLKVTLTLTNRGGKLAQLEFPTSQRVEVLIKSKDGKTIEQWSQDQAFNNEPTLVTINPRERLEYAVNVATRDMSAGQTYIVEGFFPNFEALRKSIPVAAEK